MSIAVVAVVVSVVCVVLVECEVVVVVVAGMHSIHDQHSTRAHTLVVPSSSSAAVGTNADAASQVSSSLAATVHIVELIDSGSVVVGTRVVLLAKQQVA